MKQDIIVCGMPERYLFSSEEVLAMPVLSTSNHWERRDCGDPHVKVETYQKKDGSLSISIAVNTRLDGSGQWTPYGTYSSNRVEVSSGCRSLKR